MNTRRSVWLRNARRRHERGRAARTGDAERERFLRSRRRVSSTAAVVAETRERNPETATPTRSATSAAMASQSHESASSSNTPRSPSAKTTRPGASLPSGAAYRRKAARARNRRAAAGEDPHHHRRRWHRSSRSETTARLAPRTASSPPSRRPARVNARFSHANVACASGRMRSPALERGGEEGTGRDACVRVSVADAEHAASREVVARGRAFETGSGEGNTHVLPARIVSCVVRDIPDAARSLGAHRALLWRRDWTRCRGQPIGTQLFSSRAHGAMSSLHF